MSMPNAFDPRQAGALSPEDRTLIARRSAAMGAAYRLFYSEPLHLVRGEGVWLWDAGGRRYLDAYNNVASVGHCHPRVVAALGQQAATLNTHTRYLHPLVVDYAERLLDCLPAPLANVMFTCTGSEANDLAIRIARAATGADGVIVTGHAYHGVTETLAGMSPALGPTSHCRRRCAPSPPPIRRPTIPQRGSPKGFEQRSPALPKRDCGRPRCWSTRSSPATASCPTRSAHWPLPPRRSARPAAF